MTPVVLLILLLFLLLLFDCSYIKIHGRRIHPGVFNLLRTASADLFERQVPKLGSAGGALFWAEGIGCRVSGLRIRVSDLAFSRMDRTFGMFRLSRKPGSLNTATCSPKRKT